MDVATQKINKLVQRILPDHPHHLAVSPTQRFKVPENFWKDPGSPLQYMTFVSDADRGLLLTRPYYDIRDEPETATTNSASATPRPEVGKKAVTKMTFKDYQNKQKKQRSMSPSESEAAAVRGDPRKALLGDGGFGKDSARREESRFKDTDGRTDSRSAPSRDYDQDSVRYSSSRGDLKQPASPFRDSKKRLAEPDDDARPQKRTRPEGHTPRLDDSRTPKPEAPRSKEPLLSARDKSGYKDGRSSLSQSELNGRSASKDARDRNHVASPRPSLNGVRERPGGGGSSVPRKRDNSSKQSVPPLLSPLRLALDDGDQSTRSPKKKPIADASRHVRVPSKVLKPEAVASGKRQRSPLRIPPLLSPTLPPILERELARLKETPPKGESSRSQGDQGESRGSQVPQGVRKVRLLDEDIIDEDRESRKSLVITLKYKRRNVKQVQRILALEPASKREAIKQERSVSEEGSPPPAKKRPRLAEPAVEPPPVAAKRPKTAADRPPAGKQPAPSTPLKTSTVMSRATSVNSQDHTPGDTRATPGTTASAERPSTSHEIIDPVKGAKIRMLRGRHGELSKLGTRLKHDRDDIVRPRKDPGWSLSTADEKRAVALNVEMIMAYMLSFCAFNQARDLEHKALDFTVWESLMPHLQELRHAARHSRPLKGLAAQLNALCLGELLLAYTYHDAAQVGGKMSRSLRREREAWRDAQAILDGVREEGMRASLGPWSTPEDAVAAGLRVLRRWADREQVTWAPEVSLPTTNGN